MQRRIFLSSLTAASVLTTFQPSSSSATQRRRPNQKLDVPDLLAVTEVPGIAVAGIVDGKPFQSFAGVKATADRVPITRDTIFSAASLTKPVFAWAVSDLAQKGKLDWSKPLQDYLDLGLTGNARQITAAHVLTHSTGLPNWRFQLDKPLESDFVPGSRWQYSGEGYFLLQRVVESLVGMPIAKYMKQVVLLPLGMNNSTFAWTPEWQARSVAGHDRRGKALERSSAYYAQRNYEVLEKAGLQPENAGYADIAAAYEKAKAAPLPIAMSPNVAGSLMTTAPDYFLFLKHVLADVPAHQGNYSARVSVNPKIAWTLGWGVDQSFTHPSLFHWGDGPGVKNFTWIQPERKTALVFFTNGDHGLALYSAVFRKLLDEDPASLSWL